MTTNEKALLLHEEWKGKLETVSKAKVASREDLALALENTVIVLAPLIPWGIAGAVPVATIGAPMVCMLYAFYLYLLPVWNLFTAFYHEWPGTSVPCRDA